jgi:hypothetical protein
MDLEEICCRGAWTGLVWLRTEKPEGKIPLGSSRSRWVDNIKMDLEEICCRGAWTGLVWLRTETIGELLWMR